MLTHDDLYNLIDEQIAGREAAGSIQPANVAAVLNAIVDAIFPDGLPTAFYKWKVLNFQMDDDDIRGDRGNLLLVLPAPGEGKAYLFNGFYYTVVGNMVTAYDDSVGGAEPHWMFQWYTDDGTFSGDMMTDIIDNAQLKSVGIFVANNGFPPTSVLYPSAGNPNGNCKLMLANISEGHFGGGHPDNYVNVHLYYTVIYTINGHEV